MDSAPLTNNCDAVLGLVTEGLAPTRREVRDAVRGASVVSARRGMSGIVFVAGVLHLLAEADSLNNNNCDQASLWRRVMRKQGRINRMIICAADEMLKAVGDSPCKRDSGVLADVSEHLLNARGLNSQARGNAYMRRINRPQKDLNDALNSAVALLMDYVLDPERGMFVPTDKTNALAEHLRWHVKEAGYRNYLNFDRSPWMRRILCDQYLVNRCHIVSLRLMCELLTQ